MARVREFDPADALDKAMKLFWLKGYADTSMDDLVTATGVNRYGLYDAFKNKHGLFLAALDHYERTVVGMMFGPVERPGASLAEIRAYFSRLGQAAATEAGKLGCLMSNTASEVAPFDRQAAVKVEEFRARLRNGFRKALLNAKKNGELPPALDAGQVADFLTGVVQGLSVMARSHADIRAMKNVAEVALASLE